MEEKRLFLAIFFAVAFFGTSALFAFLHHRYESKTKGPSLSAIYCVLFLLVGLFTVPLALYQARQEHLWRIEYLTDSDYAPTPAGSAMTRPDRPYSPRRKEHLK
jgi:hypothetical protein